ncbi:MAG: ABC transporter ATP-binding protein [Dehalococcoidia bacterium]
MSDRGPAVEADPSPGLTDATGDGSRDAASDSTTVISARGVGKAFSEAVVLDGIDLNVRKGELYGLIGPSGCGKTTLMRMLIGLLLPTTGDVRVRGIDPADFTPDDRRAIGYLPQEFSLYPTLTVAQNVRFAGGLYGMGWRERRRRARELLTFLELWDARNRLARALSGGMLRRLGLAVALQHRPQLLVVDEPAAGLDPALRSRLWEYLHEVQRNGTTILLSTQHVDEAERCDRVGILNDGHLIAEGAPDALRRSAEIPDRLELIVEDLDTDDIQAIWRLPGVREVRREGRDRERLLVRAHETDRLTPVLAEEFAARGKVLRSVEVTRASFEDVFLRLVEMA